MLVAPILKVTGLENGGTYSPVKERELHWATASGTPLLWTSIYEKDPALALKGLSEYAKKCAKLDIICALHNELGSSIQTQPASTPAGAATSPMSPPRRAGSIWPPSSTSPPAG